MNYKGSYDNGASYSVGDVVVFTDNIAYLMKLGAPAGTKPHDQRYWTRLNQPLQEVVIMFHSYLQGEKGDVAALQSVVFDSKTIVLASSTEDSDKVYALTVEDGESGGELSIDEVEEGDET